MEVNYLMNLIEERFRKLTVHAALNERRLSLRDEYVLRALLEILVESKILRDPFEES